LKTSSARTPGARWARAAIGLWVLIVGAGFGWLLRYGNTPGPALAAPGTWPAETGLELDPQVPTLLMFAHPRCPCTRASLHELERLVAQVGGRIRGCVLLYQPNAASDDWRDTDLARLADHIPGVRALADVDGRAARAFGARTSGHVVVYEPTGRLVFSGGLTAARGHEGDNRGRDAIRHWVETHATLEPATPVFGCELLPEERTCCEATLDS